MSSLELHRKLRLACDRYGITYMAMFGSRARGDNNSKSDIDLLIRFKRKIGLLEFVRIERELSDLLGIKVDLVTEKSLHLGIFQAIQEELEVIYNVG